MLAIAAILGIVEGVTEFLPVSSTGHLIVAGYLLNFTGERAATFEIFIQLGAVLAVVGLFWKKFMGLLSFKKNEGFSGSRGVWLLMLTTLPALIFGAGLHPYIKEHLFNPITVAAGLILGSLIILVVEKKQRVFRKENLDRLTWKDALLIGLFQCLAMWPGISRSGATIIGAMLLGVNRKTATEYSFFAAVPVVFAAAVFDLIKSAHLLHAGDLPFFAIGFMAAFFSAWLAVKLFINYVSRNTLTVFAIYRLAAAVGVLLILK